MGLQSFLSHVESDPGTQEAIRRLLNPDPPPQLNTGLSDANPSLPPPRLIPDSAQPDLPPPSVVPTRVDMGTAPPGPDPINDPMDAIYNRMYPKAGELPPSRVM